MKRALMLLFLLIPAAANAQATVRGVPIGTTCTLNDSVLNPATPVTLTWVAALGGWEGPGNGMTYRLVKDAAEEWTIRAIVTGGDFALVTQPVDLAGVSPLRWSGFIPTAGPMWVAYGYIPSATSDPRLTITITP